ncbi:MAG: hypothetical protein JW810_04430, partial [Sedimentisphaerales bacterium]|nr:hypothetical protein [Sedimentisphaerales bacterium]
PSPTITTPAGVSIEAFQAPFLQLRWRRVDGAEPRSVPYLEWLGDSDRDYRPERRVYFYPEKTSLSGEMYHSLMTMYRHPLWQGKIQRMRICLAPGESEARFEIDSFFTVYDTRHTINNPIFILASCRYFNWTGDLDFLRRQIPRLRTALRYQQTVMGGLRYNHIRVAWPGHDGLAGYTQNPDGSIVIHGGHGIGNNYWDLLPFGGDDLYATNQYYAATLALADLEEAIEQHPGWNIPLGVLRLDPGELRDHARRVKQTANEHFWNETAGRFYACIDARGQAHDYGLTFLNLDAIWYDLATPDHARRIMDWIDGRRIVAGDTSTGADIYHWRFGPRATTKRNVDWYGQGWFHPEGIPWGGQVQDGGAVLGFTFYDLWARLRLLGPDDAWQRLSQILAWERQVHAAGGYRKYYEGGRQGTNLQGGGTAGGLGIDHEFYESSLLPAIVPYAFLGLRALPQGTLQIEPSLPRACPEMAIKNLLYRRMVLDVRAGRDSIRLNLHDDPVDPLTIALAGSWKRTDTGQTGSTFVLHQRGQYHFQRGRAD